MKTRLAVLALLLLLALPVLAQNQFGNCNSTLVTQGVCRANTNQWMAFDATPAEFTRLAAWATATRPATIPCAAVRLLDRGIIARAGVASGDCTTPQIGQQVTNPQSTNDYAYIWVRNHLRDQVSLYEHSLARQAVPAPTEPGIGG